MTSLPQVEANMSGSTSEPTAEEIVAAALETSAPGEALLRAVNEVQSSESLTAHDEDFKDEFKARELANPDCPHCHGRGYIGRGVMAPICPCTQLENYKRAAGIRINMLFGRGERAMTLSSFDTGGILQNDQARNVACNFVLNWQRAKTEGWTLGFIGQPGAGKTHLVTGISIALIKRHLIKPYVLSVPKMLFAERQRFGAERGKGGRSAIEAAMQADLTVLDDIGAEQRKATDDPSQVTWVQEMLYLILDERIRHSLPTLYTSNLSLKALQEHFGEGTAGQRLWSRIERAQIARPLELRKVAEMSEKNVGMGPELAKKPDLRPRRQ